MKESSLEDLVCPALLEGARCLGRLMLTSSGPHSVPIVPLPTNSQDIHEGLVRCERCGLEYPIISGVLILVDGIGSYLVRNYSEILSVAAPHVSQSTISYLQSKGYDLHEIGYRGSLWHNALGMDLYINAHFGDPKHIGEALGRFLREAIGHQAEHPLATLLDTYGQSDFYAHVQGILAPVLSDKVQVLDVGCNVGGLTSRVAPFSRQVYAIDYSFRAAFTARRILLGLPEQISSYRVYHVGLRYESYPLSIKKCDNVEILVASGLSLPFTDGRFGLVHCANVIDVVGDPRRLLDESQRVLANGGHFLLADPYYWGIDRASLEEWLGAQPGQSSQQSVRQILLMTTDVIASEPALLWILPVYDRHLTLWLVDCVLARKRSQEGVTKGPGTNQKRRSAGTRHAG